MTTVRRGDGIYELNEPVRSAAGRAMERLTERDKKGNVFVKDSNESGILHRAVPSQFIEKRNYTNRELHNLIVELGKAAIILATYEDTGLTPERVAELAQAEQDGRLVELPCKVGDTVYEPLTEWDGTECLRTSFKPKVRKRSVSIMLIGGHGRPVLGCNEVGGTKTDYFEIGKTVFLTRAEAEAALAAKKP